MKFQFQTTLKPDRFDPIYIYVYVYRPIYIYIHLEAVADHPHLNLLETKDIWFLDSEAKPEDVTAVQAVVNVVADEHKRLEESCALLCLIQSCSGSIL